MPEKSQGHKERHQRWERFARAALWAQSSDRHAQGLSQRQAAQVLAVPRSPLPAWRPSQEHRDERPVVVAFLPSGAGLAFLPRLVLALHLVYTEGGACGMRLVCLFLRITGLDRFVGAS